MSKSSPKKSAVRTDGIGLAQLRHSLKPVSIKQQATAGRQSASPTHTAGAGQLSDSPFRADSHEHVAALVDSLSRPDKQQPDTKAASAAIADLPDSPFQPTSKAHVAGLANAVAKGITASTRTPTHTPVLDDSPFQPTSRSHVAALAGQLLERLQGGDVTRSSSAVDSPYKADSSSHVHELISSYKQAVAADNSPSTSPPRSSGAKPQTPHNTPLAPTAEQAGPFTAYRPKLVGPDDPVQGPGPQIIHISYGKQAPFKSRTSQVAQLADQFAATKAAEDEADRGATPNSSSTGVPEAGTAGKPAAGVVVNIAKDHVGPSPPPSTPSSPNKRIRSPRSKSQVVAAGRLSNTLQAAKARLSCTAANECAGVEVYNKVNSYVAEVAAANATVGDGSADGANMNPLYRPGADVLVGSMLDDDMLAD